MNEIISLIIITFLPALELRASIPYGILVTDMHWGTIFLICVITNILLGLALYPLFDTLVSIATKIGFVRRLYEKHVEKTQKRIHSYVERFGELGLAVFIGIPLPGSGVYTGTLAAYLLGLDFKRFIIGCIIGVLSAGIIVSLIMLSGNHALGFFIKT